MEKDEILVKLQDIFRDILDDEDIVLTFQTKADDIEGWDSLAHVQIVVAVSQEFGVKFSSTEIMNWPNIDSLVECIINKL